MRVSAAGGGSLGARDPEESVEIDGSILVENNSLRLQKLHLNFESVSRPEGYFPFSVDDPVPREIVLS